MIKTAGTWLIGFIMGVLVVFFFAMDGCHKHKSAKVAAREETNVIAEIKAHQFDSATYYRDQLGHEHAEKELIQGDAAAIRIFYKKKQDSLCSVLRIKASQLASMYEAKSEVKGDFNAPVDRIGINTADGPGEVRHFEYADSFLREEGWVDSSNAYITYKVKVPVHITTYWKRHWFLGKRHYFVDGYSDNPNCHIDGLTGITIN